MAIEGRINQDELNVNGRFLIESAKKNNFALRGGVAVFREDEEDSDDEICVNLVSKISWSERARLYGVQGLGRNEIARDENGHPIRPPLKDLVKPDSYLPTEEHIAAVERMHGDPQSTPTWYVPKSIVSSFQQGEISCSEALNQAGASLWHFIEAGQLEVRQ